ncbi:hypothetical protein LCGC14_2845250 [marine sediment metagenome]|uniref:Uncharacterized protein n=1 Tax=marine sediment metagenome TaxID=412755 RepID=A0A0F8YA20_9ZZZZ
MTDETSETDGPVRSANLIRAGLFLVGMIFGGGGATHLGRDPVQMRAELRATKVEIVGEIKLLGNKIATQDKALDALLAWKEAHQKRHTDELERRKK